MLLHLHNLHVCPPNVQAADRILLITEARQNASRNTIMRPHNLRVVWPPPNEQAADRILLITEARQSASPALRLPASPRGGSSGRQNEFDAAAAVRLLEQLGQFGQLVALRAGGWGRSPTTTGHIQLANWLDMACAANLLHASARCERLPSAGSLRRSRLHVTPLQAARPDLTLQHIKLPQQYIEAAYPLVSVLPTLLGMILRPMQCSAAGQHHFNHGTSHEREFSRPFFLRDSDARRHQPGPAGHCGGGHPGPGCVLAPRPPLAPVWGRHSGALDPGEWLCWSS